MYLLSSSAMRKSTNGLLLIRRSILTSDLIPYEFS